MIKQCVLQGLQLVFVNCMWKVIVASERTQVLQMRARAHDDVEFIRLIQH